ncbi:MAG TPA: type II toxin-antitoxin system VapC family toxin [Thermoanaerobaculia bacterium]
MILVDSNVPMFLVGDSDPHKAQALAVLEGALAGGQRLVTDAEVLQEILHRFTAIQRRDAIQPAFDATLKIVDEVIPIEGRDVESAKSALLESPRLSARDAIHVAVMRRHGIRQILTFDRGFDEVAGIERLPRPSSR